MKSLATLISTTVLTISAVSAADFTTGQAARLVIGQRTFTDQQPGTSQTTLGGPSGIAYANNTLFVVDSNRIGAGPVNHRVLFYDNLNGQLPAPTDELPVSIRECQVCVGAATLVLGQDVFDKGDQRAPSNTSFRSPTAIATDGVKLVVADTDHNRVLIWNSIPRTNNAPADVVLGQTDFSRTVVNDGRGATNPNETGLRGPQGVWIQNGRLYVADSGNNRILIWNSIPTSNHAAANLVLGQSSFNAFVEVDLTRQNLEASQTRMLNPVSVTSDGQRLYVADLGFNRVLIWNSIPTSNNQPADVVLGQPDFTAATVNNSRGVCPALEQKDADGNDLFPERCEATMEFPRFALSDGKYLFVADGGNDRILVYNTIPTTNGAKADAILGQITPRFNLISDSADPRGIAASGSIRTPLALAFDGTNLYASDPFNRRIMVFTVAERKIPNSGVRNAASREIFSVGGISFDGTLTTDNEATIKIGEREYKYKIVANDTFDNVVTQFANLINAGAGDPEAFATPNLLRRAIILTARVAGITGDSVAYSASVSTNATIVLTTVGATLQGGQDAAQIAPGTIVTIFGENLAEATVGTDPNAQQLPYELGGVQVYVDGIRAPVLFVSPEEVRAQVPWDVFDRQSANAYIRTSFGDGRVSVTTAVAVPIIPQNPGIFAVTGVADPRPGIVLHGSSQATGTVSVDGTSRAGDIATVRIEDRAYTYTVRDGDTLANIRDGLIEAINQDPRVEASPAGVFTRIRLRARIPGPEGNGIAYSAAARDGDQVILTATTPSLCCANTGLVTAENPALPGETIILTATGLGLVQPREERELAITGSVFQGTGVNEPLEFVSSLAGARTANVLAANLKPGTIGLYEVVLELNSDLPTDPATQLTIAQDIFVSNIITIPVFNPRPAEPVQ